MGKSLSDSVIVLRPIPRWVWVLLFVLALIFRFWILIAALGAVILFLVLLTILGIIAFAEITDNDGPGHKNKNWWFR